MMPQDSPMTSPMDQRPDLLSRAPLPLLLGSMTMTTPAGTDVANMSTSRGSYTTTFLSSKLGFVAVMSQDYPLASIPDRSATHALVRAQPLPPLDTMTTTTTMTHNFANATLRMRSTVAQSFAPQPLCEIGNFASARLQPSAVWTEGLHL